METKEEKSLNLETSKNLGGVGAILMFIGVLPLFAYSGIISLVGLILVLIAMYGLANYYKESGIFNNALYGVITAIVGGVVAVVVLVTAAMNFFADIGLDLWNLQDVSALSGVSQDLILTHIWDFIAIILVAWVILVVFVIIAAVFIRKSLGFMSSKTGVGLFGTTALLILIGAVLMIIFIGALLIWIALLLLAVAFFQIKPQQT